MHEVITNNLDLWTAALLTNSTTGRNGNGKQEAYGIKKLRTLILELAVRGKLVPQDPNDEPTNVLMERIAKEKERLIKEGEFKKEKSLPDIGEDKKPFALPNGWEWSRLKDVSSYIQRGKGPQYADYGRVQVVSQKCIQWSGFDLTEARYVDDESLEGYQPERFINKDDLLWNSTGTGTVGRINVVPDVDANSLVADSHVTIIRPLMMNSGFLRCYVAAPGIQRRIEPEHENSLVSGTTKQVELNLSAVVQLVVPVPPPAEQHRIVAKVDELMALCDQLEQQQTHSIEAHQTLVETLLGTLTRVESQQELTEAWTRVANHFDTVFTTEHSIDQLKKTVLELAVMGKLVPQNPNDEPTSELLKKIAAEKARLAKEGKIKKEESLPEIAEDEKPFVLPEGWKWSRFGDLWVDSFYGPRFGKDEYVTHGGYPTIRTTDMTADGKINLKDPPEVIVDESKLSLYGLEMGDLLITRSGSIGTMAIYDLDIVAIPSAYLIRVRVSKPMLPEYTLLMLRSPLGQSYLGLNTTSVGVPNVNATKMARFVFAIPPEAEQHRIVAKVNELLALCDGLKARLNDAQTTQIHLADAIVEQAVA